MGQLWNENMDTDISEDMHSVSYSRTLNRCQCRRPLVMWMPGLTIGSDHGLGQGRVTEAVDPSTRNSRESVARQRALPLEDKGRIVGRYISGARRFP